MLVHVPLLATLPNLSSIYLLDFRELRPGGCFGGALWRGLWIMEPGQRLVGFFTASPIVVTAVHRHTTSLDWLGELTNSGACV